MGRVNRFAVGEIGCARFEHAHGVTQMIVAWHWRLVRQCGARTLMGKLPGLSQNTGGQAASAIRRVI